MQFFPLRITKATHGNTYWFHSKSYTIPTLEFVVDLSFAAESECWSSIPKAKITIKLPLGNKCWLCLPCPHPINMAEATGFHNGGWWKVITHLLDHFLSKYLCLLKAANDIYIKRILVWLVDQMFWIWMLVSRWVPYELALQPCETLLQEKKNKRKIPLQELHMLYHSPWPGYHPFQFLQ